MAGKPIRDCGVEVAKVAEMFRCYAGWADTLHGEVIPVPSGHLNYTLREPLGVVFQITLWNAPVFSGAGQSCVAGARLLVHQSVHAELTEIIAAGMNGIRLGDPLDDATEVVPVTIGRQFAHVNSMIRGARDAGTKVRTRDRKPDTGFFVPPAVLSGLGNTAAAAQTEIFGPVVTAIPFTDEDEAIAIANDTQFGPAGAVWTSNAGCAHRVSPSVRAGTFRINSYKAIHVSSPFGISLNSGFGRSSGSDALMEYTSPRSVWLDSGETPKVSFGYVS